MGAFRRAAAFTGVVFLLLSILQLYIIIKEPPNRFSLMRVQKLIILQTILSYLSYYVYRSYKISWIWSKLVILTVALAHFSFFAQFLFIYDDPTALTILPFLGFSLVIFLGMGTLAGDIGTFLFIPFTLKISVGYQRFKLHSVPIAALVLTLWSFVNTLLPPQHSSIHVPVRDLGHEWDNFHIIHLSDIHTGPTTGRSFVNWIVEQSNSHHPDAVFITGDLVDSSVKKLKRAVFGLKNLSSKHGTFYVTGNHEYYTNDVDNWLTYLESLGLQTLHNEHRLITSKNGSQICIAGVDDPQAEKMSYTGHSPNPVAATRGCPPGVPVVMLAHQPKAAKLTLDSVPRVDLILSGHTHGGQIFPLHIPVWLGNAFFAVLYQPRPDTHVYVSRGLRFYGAPARFFSYPQYTSVFLHPAP